jgi:hypothetical protein
MLVSRGRLVVLVDADELAAVVEGDQDAKATAECSARAGCHARLLPGVRSVSRVFAAAAGSD